MLIILLFSYRETAKYNISVIPTARMNSNKNTRTSHNKDRTNATVAVPVTGAIVTAAILLSGLSLIGSYQQPVLAQQQAMTGAGGTTGAGGGTTGGGTVCILITRDDTAGNTTTTTTATSDAAAQGGNATTTATTAAAGRAGEEGNGSIPQIRTHIQDAITAFQNSDAQGVMNSLDLADKALGGAGLIQDNNMTAAETAAVVATNMTTTGGAS